MTTAFSADPAVLLCYCHLPCPKCGGQPMAYQDGHRPPGHVHISDLRGALGLSESSKEGQEK